MSSEEKLGKAHGCWVREELLGLVPLPWFPSLAQLSHFIVHPPQRERTHPVSLTCVASSQRCVSAMVQTPAADNTHNGLPVLIVMGQEHVDPRQFFDLFPTRADVIFVASQVEAAP
jgi:hypothetical protein